VRVRHLDGPLDLGAIGPQVLVLGAGGHHRTRLGGAEFGDAAVEQVDLVEEVHRVDGQPLVDVLPLGQLHGQPQVATAQGRLGLCPRIKKNIINKRNDWQK